MSTTPCRSALVAACLLVLVVLPRPVAAQDCGDWRYPVLCGAELAVARDGGRWEELRGAELTLGPDEEVEIRLEGVDQWGRSFRADRLMLGIEGRDCERLVEITDRGQGELAVEPEVSEGRCRLGLWVPGNLNFEWELQLSVRVAARTGYSREEAEFVARGLYRAILGREPDATGLSGAVSEIDRGRLDAQVESMVRSDEFRRSIQGMGSEELLERFYQGLVGRSPSDDDVRRAQDALRRGAYADVVLSIVRSPEFEQRLQERS